MKSRMIPFVLAILLLLTACAPTPAAETVFHISQQTVEFLDTGDLQQTLFEYDDQWRMTATIYCENGSEVSRISYQWSSDSTTCTVTGSGAAVFQEECAYTYDEAGNVLTLRRYEDGVLLTSQEKTYDEQGRLLIHSTSAPAQDLHSRITYRYDGAGNCVETVSDFGDFTLTVSSTYDSQRRLLTQASETGWVEYEYRDSENLTVVSNYLYLSSGSGEKQLSGTVLITRDAYGNDILQEHYNELGELTMQIATEYFSAS